MKKGDSTRSGMLWEVERILDECKELNTLPNILFMENVPEVIGKKNIKDFQQWVVKLESLGYSNYVECLNSKDYGIPQNRNRCFMISILGDFLYKFPMPFKLQLRLKDLLEPHVDEKYYLSDKMINYISSQNQKWTGNNNGAFINKDVASTLNTGEGSRRCDASNYVSNDLPDNFDLLEVKRIFGIFDKDNKKRQAGSVYDKNGLAPTLDTAQGGWRQPCIIMPEKTKKGYVESKYSEYSLKKIKGNIVQDDVVGTITASAMQSFSHDNCHLVVEENRFYKQSFEILPVTKELRIRKLTPKECFRLMGVKDEDFDKIKINQTDTSLYHLAGDSIVVDVMKHIFKNLL